MLRPSFLLAALVALAPLAHAQPTADVPVERVILFTSGVGYFEHAGSVRGDAEVTLRFDETALNDVLKSLLVEDPGGRVAGVLYPTRAPLERTLRAFALDLSGAPDLPALLRQARGAEVDVEARGGSARGTIVAVGEQPGPDRGPPTAVLTILTRNGLAVFPLDEVRRIAFTDPAMQDELEGALAALAESRGGGRQPVRVQFRGAGDRRVRLGYVVEAPVWKTSYRLVLPERGARAGTLQGWALVENPTEADWTNVDLTLVSGRPVSFVMDLYTPRYVERPVVALPDDAVVRPESYSEGSGSAPVVAAETDGVLIQRDAIGPPGDEQNLYIRGGRSSDVEYYTAPPPPPAPMDLASGVEAQGTRGDFGELFAYRLGGVTLPRRGSAMLPIVQEGVEAERLSVYSGSVGRHPMRGVRLTNTTGAALRGGPLTVLDDGYAGDALLPDLPAGAERLLSFAVDQDVLVDPFVLPDAPGEVTTASLRDGILTLRRQALASAGYRVENRGARERTVLIEHPRQSGGTLVQPATADETAPGLYRLRVEVAAGATDTLVVREARLVEERVALWNEAPERLLLLARADGALPDDVRRAVEEAVDRRRVLAETERQMQAVQQEIQEITTDQERIRGNLQAVSNASAYGRRLLARLNEQETRLDTLRERLDTLGTEAEEQRQRLRVTVR